MKGLLRKVEVVKNQLGTGAYSNLSWEKLATCSVWGLSQIFIEALNSVVKKKKIFSRILFLKILISKPHHKHSWERCIYIYVFSKWLLDFRVKWGHIPLYSLSDSFPPINILLSIDVSDVTLSKFTAHCDSYASCNTQVLWSFPFLFKDQPFSY